MSANAKYYQRFSIPQRIEHIVLLVSFTLLGVTGLSQKYAAAGVSEWLIAAMGGIEAVRIIHRVASTVFVLQSVYHFYMIGYKLFVLRKEASMLPGVQDLKDAFQAFGFNLGLVKKAPKLPRYNFAEKAEYWALLWGLVLMGLTGFMLWNPIATANFLPGQFIPAAKAAHGGEAVLAVLAIIWWHFYNVHVKLLNGSMFHGKMTRHEMEEEHGMELEKIEAGKLEVNPTPEEISRRARIYIPTAGLVSLAATAAVLWFITFEQTAITTIPPVSTVVAFSPQTPTPIPPTATPRPTVLARQMRPGEDVQATTWDGGIGALIDEKCGACHGKSGGLGLKSYADVVKGGAGGPVFTAGDPENSLLLTKVKDGSHPGKFSADELKAIADWIQNGAPEKE
jgi:cytochrome b subunit of formate dehydrogenase